MYCKDCKFRDKHHRCTNEKIDEGYDFNEESDALIYPYVEGGCFYVGDKFGCVHFKQDKPR